MYLLGFCDNEKVPKQKHVAIQRSDSLKKENKIFNVIVEKLTNDQARFYFARFSIRNLQSGVRDGVARGLQPPS